MKYVCTSIRQYFDLFLKAAAYEGSRGFGMFCFPLAAFADCCVRLKELDSLYVNCR